MNERRRAAREKAHELLGHRFGTQEQCDPGFGGHGDDCDAVVAHLLSIDEAHAAEVEGLREAAVFADAALVAAEGERDALRAELARVTAERDEMQGVLKASASTPGYVAALYRMRQERDAAIEWRDRNGREATLANQRVTVLEREAAVARAANDGNVAALVASEWSRMGDGMACPDVSPRETFEVCIRSAFDAGSAALRQRERVLREALEKAHEYRHEVRTACPGRGRCWFVDALATPTDPTTNETGGT